MSIHSFKTKTKISLPGISKQDYTKLWQGLGERFGIKQIQITEAASYSMAMVVRFALGLSASGGRTYAIASDSPAGWVSLATLRHLVNGGADGGVIITAAPTNDDSDFAFQLSILDKMGVPIYLLGAITNDIPQLIESCHNVICGLYSRENPSVLESSTIDILNEAKTPIHSIEAPLGIDVDTGKGLDSPLYSSSTLSLGLPYIGLSTGSDFVGRHYLCDISVPLPYYREFGVETNELFADQPVVQIFPSKDTPTENP